MIMSLNSKLTNSHEDKWDQKCVYDYDTHTTQCVQGVYFNWK